MKGYPRLSETFIAQEMLGLERRNVPQLIVSLRHPTDKSIHDLHAAIRADVLYLPEYLQDEPKRVRLGRAFAEAQPGYALAFETFQRDLARDRSVNRRRRFGQACVLARELPDDVDWLHAHYLHTPASVTRYASLIRGLPWSFSAHAKDVWTTPEWELREKLADARWGVTCTRINLDYLATLAPKPERLHLVYHGLDLSGVPQVPARAGDPAALKIVSVGRAVEKKGYGTLLTALAAMRDDPRWSFHHVGGGELAKTLKADAEQLGLSQRIVWHGSQPRGFIFDLLAGADLFVLPCRVARSGDRDGLPNVLMEAQAFSVPVLSTAVSGIPELVTHGVDGWLVPPGDSAALADAMRMLIDDPGLRIRLGDAGAATVRQKFSAAAGIDYIAGLLGAARARRRAA